MITRPSDSAQRRPRWTRFARASILLATVAMAACSQNVPRSGDTLSLPPTRPAAALPVIPPPVANTKTPAAAPVTATEPTPAPAGAPAIEDAPEKAPAVATAKEEKAENKDSLLYKILHPVELITGRKKPKVEPGLAPPSNDLWAEYRKRSVLPDCKGSPIAERYAREYASMQGFMDRTMIRAEPFLYFILEQARAEGVPSDLVLLPIIESQFDPELTSSQGAAGMWQFMPATGRLMGLTIQSDYDGRLDAFSSTQAAMRYFKRLAVRFDDDYLLAMAAYNVGDGRLLRELRGKFPPFSPSTVFSLSLPQETKNHIAKWVGLSCLFKHPARYGFELPVVAFKPQLRKINVGERSDVRKIATLARLELDWLKHLNPGYRSNQTPEQGPHYFLLPVVNADRLDVALTRMGPAERSTLAAQSAAEPTPMQKPAASQPVPVSGLRDPTIRANAGMKPAAIASGATHTVRAGESAWIIARAKGVRLADLLALNGLNQRSKLKVGQRIRLPVSASAANTTTKTAALPEERYKVLSGDSAWTIAKRFNLSLEQLLKLNNINRASRLKPGMLLRVK